MASSRIEFPGSLGTTLAARLDRPAQGRIKAYALFAHCFTCTKDIFAASRIAQTLADSGVAVLRFDFTGLGHSEGEFANSNFSSNVDDLLAAADFLRGHHEAPRLLIGHSLGGAAVLAAAGRVPEATAVATIGAPADPAHVQHLFEAARPEIEARGEAEVAIGGRPFRIRRQFLEDLAAQNLDQSLASLGKALLVFHAPRDATVGIENAGRIFAAAKHPKSFVSLDDADHLLTRKADARYVASVLAAWAERYLPQEEAEEAPRVAKDEVLVRANGEGRFGQDVIAGRHVMRADEPLAVGGLDLGPSPYGYLLAGLGACTAMTLRLYADRQAWPLQEVSVRLHHDKIHAADCESCETKEGRVDRIERVIELQGPLDANQHQRLLEIADRCPVHRTLEREVEVRSRLA